jgi:hypothetical protein
MEIAAGGGILRHAGRLQQNFFERRLIPLRQRLDRRAVQGIDIGAGLGEELALKRVGRVCKGVSRLGRGRRRGGDRGRRGDLRGGGFGRGANLDGG